MEDLQGNKARISTCTPCRTYWEHKQNKFSGVPTWITRESWMRIGTVNTVSRCWAMCITADNHNCARVISQTMECRSYVQIKQLQFSKTVVHNWCKKNAGQIAAFAAVIQCWNYSKCCQVFSR